MKVTMGNQNHIFILFWPDFKDLHEYFTHFELSQSSRWISKTETSVQEVALLQILEKTGVNLEI